jgi:uncharacterized membrane protein
METLTDGIFAIVMTVMIVSLAEVMNFTAIREQDFHKFFLSLGNDFISYAVSFLILGLLWFEHHWQFHYIKHIDPILVFLHILWFMFICLIPFMTMLAGNHPQLLTPMLAFEIDILIVCTLLYASWAYATHRHRLVEPSLDKKIISDHRMIGLSLIVIASVAISVSILVAVLKT